MTDENNLHILRELEATRLWNRQTCIDGKETLSWKDKIAYLAWMMKGAGVEMPLKHSFEGEFYVREITIPAGVYFIGREHIEGHLVELVKGKVMLITEHDRRVLLPPFAIHTKPGYQMVCFAITEVVGRTYHLNPEQIRDVQVLEDKFFRPAEEVFERGRQLADGKEAGLLRGVVA